MFFLFERLNEMWRLIAPRYCTVCGCRIEQESVKICRSCREDMPRTRFALTPDNPLSQRCRDIDPRIVHASALLFYRGGSPWRRLIHRFKYHGNIHLGDLFGELLGQELIQSPIYQDIDFVVAIPLHPIRHFGRGFNQCHSIGRAVAREMGVKFRLHLLRRTRYNTPQVGLKHQDRWQNTENLFGVVDAEAFANRSVLLIDDVFTTGATTISCAQSILAAAPSCRLYIAVIATPN